MRTKQEYYELILGNRKIASKSENIKCTCTQTLCEWHGRCQECVALHRYNKDHIPVCLQSFINDKLKEIVKIGELIAVEKEKTPIEYRRYVKEQDKKLNINKEWEYL